MAMINATDDDVRYWCMHWPNRPRVGGRLWVREAWQLVRYVDDSVYPVDWPTSEPIPKAWPSGWTAMYRASDSAIDGKWRPSIHMPRYLSRITLEIVGVCVQRLQKITGRDAIAEGVTTAWPALLDEWDQAIGGKRIASVAWENAALKIFRDLWDSINLKRGFGWDTDPWVWVVEFRRVE